MISDLRTGDETLRAPLWTLVGSLSERQSVADNETQKRRWSIGNGSLWSCVLVGVCVAGVLVPMGFGVRASVRASRRSECGNHLKQIMLALHEYEHANEHFPAAAITASDGKLLLSWRVAILPEMGYRELYDAFHRAEPWDSPHNLALLSKIPDAYRCASELSAPPGYTNYQAIVGPKPGLGVTGAMFEWRRGIDIREVLDGASQTIMVAEAPHLVPWTKPEDHYFDEHSSAPSFASRHADGFNVLFADGSVKFLKYTIQPMTLRSLLTRNGGEVFSAG